MEVKVIKKAIPCATKKKFSSYYGHIFTIDGEPHMLSQIIYNRVCLISLIEGNRWDDPIPANPNKELYDSEVVWYLKEIIKLKDVEKVEYLGKCEIIIKQL